MHGYDCLLSTGRAAAEGSSVKARCRLPTHNYPRSGDQQHEPPTRQKNTIADLECRPAATLPLINTLAAHVVPSCRCRLPSGPVEEPIQRPSALRPHPSGERGSSYGSCQRAVSGAKHSLTDSAKGARAQCGVPHLVVPSAAPFARAREHLEVC